MDDKCTWTYEDDYDYYETTCEFTFSPIDGPIDAKEGWLNYCCNCGKPVEIWEGKDEYE